MEGTRRFINGVSLMTGTIIGVGLFGLPYVAARAGLLTTAVHVMVLSGVAFLAAAMYAEVVTRSPQRMRLPGYVGRYLGKRWRRVAVGSNTLGLFGALVAYVIVGGHFFAGVLQPYLGGPTFAYVAAYYLAGFIVIAVGQRAVVGIEVALLVVFFFLLAWLVAQVAPLQQWQHWAGGSFKDLLLPYGVALFSVWGVAIVPEVIDEVGQRHRQLVPAVLGVSTALAALTYLVFTAAIVGVTGPQTSVEGIAGLTTALPPHSLSVLYAFGIITTFTSFISLGGLLHKVTWYDLGWPRAAALAAVAAVPGLFVFAPKAAFITVIGLTGAVALGVDACLIFCAYRRLRGRPHLLPPIPRAVSWLLALLLAAGVAAELGNFTAAWLKG